MFINPSLNEDLSKNYFLESNIYTNYKIHNQKVENNFEHTWPNRLTIRRCPYIRRTGVQKIQGSEVTA